MSQRCLKSEVIARSTGKLSLAISAKPVGVGAVDQFLAIGEDPEKFKAFLSRVA
jgi:hypothetical protein